ncbi:MAG: acetyl-CoA hydrolase/transferase family protein [Deltaproteobacteria bacterium]|nr:MAG: acetyl-CoA hydrolase/transferase family protein [Deltaproteobacteria bacterium]
MSWSDLYRARCTTAREAVARIPSGAKVVVHGGCAVPSRLVDALVARAAELRNVEIAHILHLGPAPYVAPDLARSFRHRAFFTGGNVRAAVREGRAEYVPIHLSEVPALFRSGAYPVDVALLHLSPPDEHGFCSLGVDVGIHKAAAESARRIVAQVNPRMPRTLGDSFLHVSRLDAIVEVDDPLPELEPGGHDETTRAIGRHVAGLVDDGATLQLGIGAIPDAVLAELEGHRDLGLHTEMFSDGLMALVEKGVVTNARKSLHPGKSVTGFCLGSRALFDFVDDNPLFEFRPTEYVNDPFVIARNDRMVAVNSALEVDLTGQVCADSLGTSIYSGIGGQVDFVRGAARSRGGRAIIALPSTAKGGTVSRIVPSLRPGAGVVTTRGDVHYVVTEHGVADLHGRSLRERVRALLGLADPRFREDLERSAHALGLPV